MTQEFLVTADHVDPYWACENMLFRVKQDIADGRFYAQARKYGCGRNYATPESAIRWLLKANGCTNVRIIASATVVAGS